MSPALAGELFRRAWQPTPVFLPGKSHGQRSLVSYSPWGCKESDTTEQLSTHVLHYSHVSEFEQTSGIVAMDSRLRSMGSRG